MFYWSTSGLSKTSSTTTFMLCSRFSLPLSLFTYGTIFPISTHSYILLERPSRVDRSNRAQQTPCITTSRPLLCCNGHKSHLSSLIFGSGFAIAGWFRNRFRRVIHEAKLIRQLHYGQLPSLASKLTKDIFIDSVPSWFPDMRDFGSSHLLILYSKSSDSPFPHVD
jgi:hypothetical protein